MTHPSARSTSALAALLALAAACSSTGSTEGEESVPWLVRHGRYAEAVELAAERRNEDPDDQRAIDEHRLASAAWHMERGRRLSFENQNEEALQAFAEAKALAPEEPVVDVWIKATRDRLADEWLERGLEAHNADDLEGAIADYEKALSFVPDHAPTRETLARALLQLNYRRGMGEDYYDDGVRALDRYFLHEAHSLFSYVLKYEPKNDRAHERGDQTQELLAAERATMASELEAQGDFSAARNEYRLALLLAPELAAAQEGLERMQREEQAADLLREADRLGLQGRFDEAEQRLDQAGEITERQQPQIEAHRASLHDARLERLYEVARTLESDWRYEEAVAAYGKLLEREPYFRDAIARRDTLQSYVEQAAELYGKYEAATSAEERLTYLRQIAVFWPEYRDVKLRLAELEGTSPGGV
jgi:tetratricopeptide (TPR) repeat protein